jgi:GNAT superfamily N-acetyltransferase
VLAWLAGEPAGWAAVAPRAAYPRVLASRVLAAAGGDDGDPGVWALTCFVVRASLRRRGVAGALLDGAVDLAREHGARVVEAYPVDVAAKAGASSSELYHGTLSMFAAAGFTEVARSGTARPVVRLGLAG